MAVSRHPDNGSRVGGLSETDPAETPKRMVDNLVGDDGWRAQAQPDPTHRVSNPIMLPKGTWQEGQHAES